MLTAKARDRSGNRRLRAQRAAVVVAAAALIIAAETAATLTGGAPRSRNARHPTKTAARTVFPPKRGEPQVAYAATAPPAVRAAAARFVHDDLAWQSGRLAAIPTHDATRRIVRTLERAGRHHVRNTPDPAKALRLASVGTHQYVVTSAMGNFLLARHGSRWLVISLPGD